MTLSVSGLKLIGAFEGLRLKAYKDSAGIPTIGYGHIKGVKMGDTCTAEQAEAWLSEETAIAAKCVNHMVTVPLSQNEFDALVSFAYNCGCFALEKSTLLKMLNAGDINGAAEEFMRWNKAGGKEVLGLTNRRMAEKLLFLGDKGEN